MSEADWTAARDEWQAAIAAHERAVDELAEARASLRLAEERTHAAAAEYCRLLEALK